MVRKIRCILLTLSATECKSDHNKYTLQELKGFSKELPPELQAIVQRLEGYNKGLQEAFDDLKKRLNGTSFVLFFLTF